MSCDFTAGWTKGCKGGAPGIIRAYIANFDDITVTEGSEGLITAISTGSGAGFYTITPFPKTSTWNDNGTGTPSNTSYTPSVTLQLASNDAATRNFIKLAGRADAAIIVEQSDGKYFMPGSVAGMNVTTAEYVAGQNPGDQTAWTVTFEGFESEPALEVTGSIIDAAKA